MVDEEVVEMVAVVVVVDVVDEDDIVDKVVVVVVVVDEDDIVDAVVVVVVVEQFEQMCLLSSAWRLTWNESNALFWIKTLLTRSCICPDCGMASEARELLDLAETRDLDDLLDVKDLEDMLALRKVMASLSEVTKDLRLKRNG